MSRDEILFAFNLENGVINPEDIISFSAKNYYIVPINSLNNEVFKKYDENLFDDLSIEWEEIIDNYIYVGFHDYIFYRNWRDACNTAGIIF